MLSIRTVSCIFKHLHIGGFRAQRKLLLKLVAKQAVVDAQGGQGNALPVPLTGGLPDGGHVFAEVGTQERGSRPAIAPAPRASAGGICFMC